MTELLRTLFVSTPGTSLHLEGDTIRIHHPERPGRHIQPLIRIDQLVVWRGVDVSDELMLRCLADDRGITWLTRNGRFLGRAGGAQLGNPLLRLEQVRAYDDAARRLTIAKSVVAGKLQNYRQLLLRIARDADGARQSGIRAIAERHAEALVAVASCGSLTELLGIEGNAARAYFEAMPLLAKGVPPGRSRRPPENPFNCVLSFCYGMLRVAVIGALEQRGLDPYIGYLHGVRPGKPSLALDLMEELRPLLVDRLVLTLFNRRRITAAHTRSDPAGGVALTDEGRALVLTEWSQARERAWRHSGLNRDVPAALLPIVQTRLFARHLRGDEPAYTPWIAS
ncbi:CRISPR-associated endonuclease Cas1 [Actinoalloteichus sp. GBA129-24]|uniref:CRISPR-associated endonuclease Cas1 n=1 Tax=Actinoalloteichus sp. GBA129-24 TaxID=1612551 RepID=UPI00095098F0|nr:CRISPR-associated endonuclease Cas1 [Actinoalloteichus sp. GBA129-24]APU20786.1 CRISPR-associated endonuclease Cas1 [Actinoalloteichus sp. GBA129-24]